MFDLFSALQWIVDLPGFFFSFFFCLVQLIAKIIFSWSPERAKRHANYKPPSRVERELRIMSTQRNGAMTTEHRLTLTLILPLVTTHANPHRFNGVRIECTERGEIYNSPSSIIDTHRWYFLSPIIGQFFLPSTKRSSMIEENKIFVLFS